MERWSLSSVTETISCDENIAYLFKKSTVKDTDKNCLEKVAKEFNLTDYSINKLVAKNTKTDMYK